MNQTDILRTLAWEQMPLHLILRLCRTNKQIAQLCSNPYTWKFLLNRDFGITSKGDNAKGEYIGHLLRKFAKLNYDEAMNELSERPELQISQTDSADDINAKIGEFFLEDMSMIKLNENYPIIEEYQRKMQFSLSALGIDKKVYTWFGNPIGKTLTDQLRFYKEVVSDELDDQDLTPLETLSHYVEELVIGSEIPTLGH